MKKFLAALAFLALLLPSIAFADVFAGPTTLSAPGTVVLGTGGSATVVVTATGSPTTPAFTIQGSSDDPSKVAVGAATWTALSAAPVGGGAVVTSMSGTGKWVVNAAGMARVRVNLTAIAGGSIVFTLEGGPGVGVLSVTSLPGVPLNVLSFGAVGDCVHDDTANIQAALNTNRSVYFPAPSSCYKITDELVVNGVAEGTGQILFGAGYGEKAVQVTVIKQFTANKNAFKVYCSPACNGGPQILDMNIVYAGPQSPASTFTGSIATTTTLTATAVTGTILVGQAIHGVGILPGTTIASQSSGTTGGAGVYVLSVPSYSLATIASEGMFGGSATTGSGIYLTGSSGTYNGDSSFIRVEVDSFDNGVTADSWGNTRVYDLEFLPGTYTTGWMLNIIGGASANSWIVDRVWGTCSPAQGGMVDWNQQGHGNEVHLGDGAHCPLGVKLESGAEAQVYVGDLEDQRGPRVQVEFNGRAVVYNNGWAAYWGAGGYSPFVNNNGTLILMGVKPDCGATSGISGCTAPLVSNNGNSVQQGMALGTAWPRTSQSFVDLSTIAQDSNGERYVITPVPETNDQNPYDVNQWTRGLMGWVMQRAANNVRDNLMIMFRNAAGTYQSKDLADTVVGGHLITVANGIPFASGTEGLSTAYPSNVAQTYDGNYNIGPTTGSLGWIKHVTAAGATSRTWANRNDDTELGDFVLYQSSTNNTTLNRKRMWFRANGDFVLYAQDGTTAEISLTNGSVGVSCSGTPTSSFASVGGIVTHC